MLRKNVFFFPWKASLLNGALMECLIGVLNVIIFCWDHLDSIYHCTQILDTPVPLSFKKMVLPIVLMSFQSFTLLLLFKI